MTPRNETRLISIQEEFGVGGDKANAMVVWARRNPSERVGLDTYMIYEYLQRCIIRGFLFMLEVWF